VKDIKRIFYDVEISPCTAWVWRTGKQQITHKQILSPNKIICLAWEEETTKKGGILYWDDNQDDKEIVEAFQEIAANYDMVIGQNSDKFDNRHVAARLAYHSSKPLHISTSEDTYKQTKKSLALPAYNLDYLGNYFGVGRKVKVDADLWIDVVFKNDRTKLLQMGKYCKQDVKLDKAVWKRLYPYVEHKTNYAALNNDPRMCPRCGSTHIEYRGYQYNKLGVKRQVHCLECFRYSLVGKNELRDSSLYPR
jgi:DNA polymerase elongation subunit (family B)